MDNEKKQDIRSRTKRVGNKTPIKIHSFRRRQADAERSTADIVTITLRMDAVQWDAIDAASGLEFCSPTQFIDDAIASAVSRMRKRHSMLHQVREGYAEREGISEGGAQAPQ